TVCLTLLLWDGGREGERGGIACGEKTKCQEEENVPGLAIVVQLAERSFFFFCGIPLKLLREGVERESKKRGREKQGKERGGEERERRSEERERRRGREREEEEKRERGGQEEEEEEQRERSVKK